MEKRVEDYEGIFKKKKVLITGGLGFIGSNLAIKLVELGAEVLLVDSLIPEYGGNLFNISGYENELTVNISDIRDEYSLKYLVQGQDYLFNLAGKTSHMDSMEDPYTDLEINTRSQLYILEACRKYNQNVKVVFTSTRQVYGKPLYLPVDEKHPLCPVDINGVNKLAGEWYHLLYNNVYGIRTTVLRLTNTIGPRMRVKDAKQTFLGLWIRLLLEKKPFEVWEGNQLRDFSYVDDTVRAMLMIASRDTTNGNVFNLGGDCIISLKDLADLLIEINGGGEYIIKGYPQDRKRIDIGSYYADYTLVKTTVGWEPQIPLRDALLRTLDYYRKHLDKYIKCNSDNMN